MSDLLHIRVGPEALIISTEEQRQSIVHLWERGLGLRVWSAWSAGTIKAISFETENGVRGLIWPDGKISQS